jgi:uncharacterized membrane protein
MGKGRLEAFSDGVIAIIITIMVLEIRIPEDGPSIDALRHVWPIVASYLVSFVFVGIYWNNHHHLLHAAQKVSAGIMWANLHLLFWLSLIPVVTGWVGHHPEAAWPTSLYGVVLLSSAIAYVILQGRIIAAHGGDRSKLAHALGADWKGKLSPLLYAAGIGVAFVQPQVSQLLYVTVAAIWLIPDRRIERELVGDREATES